jgi:hypothetical protein
VLGGLARGDRVVAMGSFLVDAETRLNPAAGSIYFGGSGTKSLSSNVKVRPSTPEDETAKIAAALAQLPAADRPLAVAQAFCPVLGENRLGVMGTPVKLMLDGRPVFLCCDGCKKSALADPAETLAKVADLIMQNQGASSAPPVAETKPPRVEDESAIETELSKLTDEDRELAKAQKYCVLLPDSRLGSMGPPRKITVNGMTAFVCCEGCEEEALANPEKSLVQLRQFQVEATDRRAAATETADEEAEISANLAKLSAGDRKVAAAQKFCIVLSDNRLGSMGVPIKLTLDGQAVFLCCSGCKKKALADPEAAVSAAARLRALSPDGLRTTTPGNERP